MAQLVVCLAENSYVLWSDTVDAPVSPVKGRSEMVSLLESEHHVTWEEADTLVRVADKGGTSDPTRTLAEVVKHNRAGPGEATLTLPELIRAYSE
jgi:hypothetical protein